MGLHQCFASWMIMFIMVSVVSADLAKDKEECADQLVGLATCLPYVGGTAKAPTLDCCTGLKQLLVKNKKCLCVLIKDRNDPQLGLNINATLALGLPATCKSPTDIGECSALLKLAPNSPDAQVFEQFANSTKGTPSPTNASAKGNSVSSSNSTPNAKDTSNGSKNKWLGAKIAVGVLVWYLASVPCV